MTGQGESPAGPGEPASHTAPITPGDRVLFIDGRYAGHVLHTNGHSFQLELDGRPIWLNARCIFNAADGHITLVCDAGGLHRYIVPA